MRSIYLMSMGFAMSCEYLTAANPEYCEVSADCSAGQSCHPTLHRCETGGPLLLRVDPPLASSKGGIELTLFGSNFRTGSTVTVNDLPAAVSTLSTEEIHVALPASPGSCGPATIKVRAPEGTEVETSTLFRYKFGTIAFSPVANPPTVDTNARSISAARLDADGINDLVVGNGTSATLSVFRGVGDLTFMSKAATSAPFPVLSTRVADWNGDGIGDVLAGSLANFLFFRGQADLNYAQEDQYVHDNKSIHIGNFNNDTRPDVIILNNLQNTVDLFLHSTDFDFNPQPVMNLPGPASALTTGDWNGDGRDDFATSDDSNARVLLFLRNGDGTFAAPSNLPTGAAPSLLAAADLDADGKLDLVIVTGGSSASLVAAFGRGDGTFQATTMQIAANPKLLVVSDLDCDGLPEAIIYHQGTTQLAVYGNRGGGRGFDVAQLLGVGAVIGSLAVSPLDADGRPDLALLTSTMPANLVLLRNAAN